MSSLRLVAPGLYADGQTSQEKLAELAAQGVRTVINLRAASEAVEYDEAAEAARLGMRYVSLPVAGADDLTPETIARFSRELGDSETHGGVLVHCASANRAGALIALDQGLTRGASRTHALAMGRAAGLASLEPQVQTLLQPHAPE